MMAKAMKQIAALPIIWSKKGKLKVLLITSRETKRWVMPKGWPMDGKKPWRAAEIEALEEAGVLGTMLRVPIGTYEYNKKLDSGKKIKCVVTLYPMQVERTLNRWPERKERTRKWFSPKGASKRVREPQLVALLQRLNRYPSIVPGQVELLKAG